MNVAGRHPHLRHGLMILVLLLFCLPENTKAEFLRPEEINLTNPPPDTLQKTLWLDYPVLIHRRTTEQIERLRSAPDTTPDVEQRRLAYQSIARVKGNAFASAIKQFTEQYIAAKNIFMSELPEFGIFSMVSPISGCSIGRDGD